MTVPSAPSANGRDRVLVVEDEPDVHQLVVFNLRDAGFDTHGVLTGADALLAIAELHPAVVVLDLMLPDVTGIEVCRRVRADPALQDVSIVMLTARSDEYDRLLGFEVGADDYVVKPFSVRELVLRVRALLRRPTARVERGDKREAPAPLRFGEIVVDLTSHRVHVGGEEVALRPIEYKLLTYFLSQPRRVLSRAELLEAVWGVDSEAGTRTIDTQIRRLREKLGAHAECIETVHRFGYKLRDDAHD
jgi:two-component system phosphate regulon response regulator PhoB